ncbi:MAG: PQQ-binding-like beta-propeller repeat protein [Candidatus Eremiobacterota bacterium]
MKKKKVHKSEDTDLKTKKKKTSEGEGPDLKKKVLKLLGLDRPVSNDKKKKLLALLETDSLKKKKKRPLEDDEPLLKKKKKRSLEDDESLLKKKKKRSLEDDEPLLKKKKKRSLEKGEGLIRKKKKKRLDHKERELIPEGPQDELSRYQKILYEDPSKIELNLTVGQLLMEKKEYEKAEKYFQDYITRKDTSESAYRHLGDCYYAQGLEEKAAGIYEKALLLNPEALDLETKVSEIRNKYSLLRDYLNQAKKALEIQDFNEAIKAYKEAANLSPGDATIYYTIGDIYENLGNRNSAYEYYKYSVETSPANLNYQKKFHSLKVDIEGVALANTDDANLRQIQYLLKTSISDKQDEHNNHCRLGEIYLYQGMYQEAQDQFRYALSIEQSARAYRGQSTACRQSGEIRKAIQSLTSAIILDNTDEKDLLNLVELYSHDNQKPEEVIPEIMRLSGLTADSPQIQFYTGILLESKDWQEASKYYEKVIEEDPELPEVQYRLGSLLLQNDLIEEAGEILKNVLILRSDHYKTMTSLGRLFMKKKDFKLARGYLKKAIKINPCYYEPCYLLGKILINEGHSEEAQIYLNKADKFGQNSPNYYIDKAEIYLQAHDLNNAIKSIAKAVTMGIGDNKIISQIVSIALEVNDYTLFEILSDAFEKQGDTEQIKVIYLKMIKLQPDNIYYRLKLSKIYRQIERYRDALGLLLNCVTEDTENLDVKLELAESHYGVAKSAFSREDWNEGEEHIKKALTYTDVYEIPREAIKNLKHKFTSRKLKVIETLLNKKFIRENLTDILKNSPISKKEKLIFNKQEIDLILSNSIYGVQTEDYHILLGDIYARTDRYEEAIELYFKALEINPKNGMIFFKYGNVLEQLENYREAADAYQDAVNLDPTNIIFYAKLAKTKLLMNEYQEVSKITEKALSISSKDYLEEIKYTADSKIWVMFKKDISRCSYNPVEKTDKKTENRLRQKWVFKPHGKISSSPLVSDRMVYIGSEDTRLYALHIENGKELWNFNTNGEIKATPVIELKNIYLASNGGFIYALEKESLCVKWLFETKSKLNSSPVLLKDMLYIGSDNGILYCLSIETGEVKWSFESGKTIISSPAINDKSVYFGTTEGEFYAVDLEGKLLWEKHTGPVESSPAYFENILYFGTIDHKVLALQAETGETVWEFETAGKVVSSPAVAYNKIFTGSEDKKIYAFDAITGDKICEYETNGEIISSPAIANGILYIGNSGGSIYTLDVNTLHVTKKEIGGKISSSPAVADGMLFIASEENGLFAFEL